MPTTLQSLPNELQREIIKDISQPDFLHLRLVSLCFCDLVADYAFEKKRLTAHLKTIDTFTKVSTSDRLGDRVRDLTVDVSFGVYKAVSDVFDVSIM